MTKPICDADIYDERKSKPAPVSEWLRVCRMQTSIKKARLRVDRLEDMRHRARKDSRKKMLGAALFNAHSVHGQLLYKVEKILSNAFKDWEVNDLQVSLDSDTCHVTLSWDWPAQQRTIIFSFADPLTVREE